MDDLILSLCLPRAPVSWLYNEYSLLQNSIFCTTIREKEFIISLCRHYCVKDCATFPEFLLKFDEKYLFTLTTTEYQKTRFLATRTCKRALIEATRNYQDEFVDWLVNTPVGRDYGFHEIIRKGCHKRPDILDQYFQRIIIGYGTPISSILKFFDELLANNSELFMEHYNIIVKYFSKSTLKDVMLLGIRGLAHKHNTNYFSEYRNIKDVTVAVYADKPELLPDTYNEILVKGRAMTANAINILKHIGTRGIVHNFVVGNTNVINYLLPDELIIPNACNNKYIRVVISRNPEMLEKMIGLVSIKMVLWIYDNNILPIKVILKFLEQKVLWSRDRKRQEPCHVWRAISILKSHGKNVPNYYKLY